MTKELWLNLPSKDIDRAREFYTQIGFPFNEQYGNSEHSIALKIGEKGIIVMLFAEHIFKQFIAHEVADPTAGSEVLISIDAESREEVDEYARRASDAGGSVFGEPGEKQGWMYGCGFSDPDGHRWNVLYMDFSKMPQQ